MEYENAQKRILEVFTQWKAPSNFKIELFVIRVGDWGGYMVSDCDDPTAVHKCCSMRPAFVFEARPVIPIEDAVRVELEIDCLPRRAQEQVIEGGVAPGSRKFEGLARPSPQGEGGRGYRIRAAGPCALANHPHDLFMTAGRLATLCTTAPSPRAFCFKRRVFLLT